MRVSLNTQRIFFGLTAIPLLHLLTGCSFYKVSAKDPGTLDQKVASQYTGKYFILRDGDQAYHMGNFAISSDEKIITSKIEVLPKEHQLYTRQNAIYRYDPGKKTAAVLSEVHIYIAADSMVHPGESYSLPIEKIIKVEQIEKNKSRSTLTTISLATVITAASLGIMAAAWLATERAIIETPFTISFH